MLKGNVHNTILRWAVLHKGSIRNSIEEVTGTTL